MIGRVGFAFIRTKNSFPEIQKYVRALIRYTRRSRGGKLVALRRGREEVLPCSHCGEDL